MAKLIDGKQISAQIKDELKEEVAQMKERGTQVCLAVILVGQDPASCVYVRNKKKACEYIGIRSISCELPEETTQEELLEKIREFNEDDSVDGILVQLPLPDHIQEDAVIEAISPTKRCGRLSSVERGRSVHRKAGICLMHACGHYSAFEAQRR